MATHTLTNTDVGPRGFWHQDAVVLVDPKQSVDVTDMTDEEIKQAKASGYFEIGTGGASKVDEKPTLTGKNKAELLKIAADEHVEIEDGATNDDIRSAIELKREAD